MKRLFESLGMTSPDIPLFEHVERNSIDPDIDMEAFNKWCHELQVSSLARSSEFTVIIGNHTKVVKLDRF